jgi:hypothetical protein
VACGLNLQFVFYKLSFTGIVLFICFASYVCYCPPETYVLKTYWEVMETSRSRTKLEVGHLRSEFEGYILSLPIPFLTAMRWAVFLCCHDVLPQNIMELSDHGIHPLKLWAKVILSSFKLISLRHFVTVTQHLLIQCAWLCYKYRVEYETIRPSQPELFTIWFCTENICPFLLPTHHLGRRKDKG